MKDDVNFQQLRSGSFSRNAVEFLSTTAILFSVQSVSAQEARDGTTLEEVVVTAEHRTQNVQEIASAVSLISSETVANSEVRNAGDVIRFVPNMSADTTDGHGRPKFYIRGIGLSDASIWNINPIGTYHDGVYIWNASTVGFPTFDLERVEVLRGPQGTLWGKNTTGGAIHFISKKPTFQPDGYLKVSYGNFNESLLEGAISGAIVGDTLAARVSVFNQESDRYAQNPIAPGKERWSEKAGRLQLLGQTDNLDATLNLHVRDFSGPVLTNGNRANPIETRFSVPSLPDRTDHLLQVGGSLTLNYTLPSGILLTSISSIEDFEREQFGGDAVPYESTRSYSQFKVDQIAQEVRLTSRDDQRLTWILGGYFFKGALESVTVSAVRPGAQLPNGNPRPRNYQVGDYESGSRAYALFGNAGYQITDKFNIALGLRGTNDKSDVDLTYRQAAAGFTFSDASYWWPAENIIGSFTTRARQVEDKTWDAVTYDVTPKYEFTDNFRAYVRYAKGYNGGNFNASANAQNLVQVIEPEYLKSYEAGFKSEWLNRRLIFNVAAFYYDYYDIQQKANTPDPNDIPFGSLNTFVNAGGGYSTGLEAELAVIPVENLTVALNLGVNRTKFTDFDYFDPNTASWTNANGNWFNRVPRVMSNFQLSYKIPLANGGDVALNTDWAYRSKAYFNAVTQDHPDLIEGAYTIGNVSAGYVSPGNKFSLRVYSVNVTDTKYRNTSLLSGSYSYGPPRTYGISGTYHFF